ncbi:MAG TPA: PHP domain-containing protein [Armatimonadota bacterium]|nr:PHP domain-containing protein [Armatimonadota bacterium]
MPRSIDLHVHTSASDGTLSPAEVVAEAAARGVWLLGIADHDTTEGIPPAQEAAAEAGLTLIPSVELSVGAEEHEIHVLGYFVGLADEPLQAVLRTLRGARDGRNERIVARLRELGAPIDLGRVKQIAGDGSVGRPHIAKALLEAGHVASESEAFGRYLARGKPGYVGRERLSPAEAAEAIRRAGGIPVLAHPGKLGSRRRIEEIIDMGMAGVEAFHSDHDEKRVALILEIAKARDLLVTGGSDSHGPHSDRPIAIGSVGIPEWVGERFLASAPDGWAASP